MFMTISCFAFFPCVIVMGIEWSIIQLFKPLQKLIEELQ